MSGYCTKPGCTYVTNGCFRTDCKFKHSPNPDEQKIAALEAELKQCITIHAEYSNRMEAKVKKCKLATCKWQDMHSDAEAENKQLTHALEVAKAWNLEIIEESARSKNE